MVNESGAAAPVVRIVIKKHQYCEVIAMKTVKDPREIHPHGTYRSGKDREKRPGRGAVPVRPARNDKSWGPVRAGDSLQHKEYPDQPGISDGHTRRHHYNVSVRTRSVPKELRPLTGVEPAAAGPAGVGPVHRNYRRSVA
jgi:hypothetical protein